MLFTVFGSPISHSLSPLIHQELAHQFNLDITYTKTLSTPSEFLFQLNQLKNHHDLIGANITAPLKQHVFNLCDVLMPRAKLVQSVNTLYWDNNNKLIGDNTDGVGFERDVYINHQQSFEDQNILLNGAGGAAAGILPFILKHSPKAIYIYNRTDERAESLCDLFNTIQNKLCLQVLNTSTQLKFDWMINTAGQFAFPQSLIDNQNQESFQNAKFYDLSYNQDGLTPYLKSIQLFEPIWFRDGIGMLVEQAAESFYIWHQKKPVTTDLVNKIRKD